MKATKITKIENGRISAPMSPMLVCKELLELIGSKPSCMKTIHRVFFDDERTLNQPDGDRSITCYDFLVLTILGRIRFFFIDMGVGFLPVLIIDQDEVTVCGGYKDAEFLRRPDEQELIRFIESIPYEDK